MFQVLFFFHSFLQKSLQKYFQSICLFFEKNTKISVKSFECPKSIKSLKKIILGTSDAWSTIRLSNPPSDPAWIYHRLTDFKSSVNSNVLVVFEKNVNASSERISPHCKDYSRHTRKQTMHESFVGPLEFPTVEFLSSSVHLDGVMSNCNWQGTGRKTPRRVAQLLQPCLLYTSDAADE